MRFLLVLMIGMWLGCGEAITEAPVTASEDSNESNSTAAKRPAAAPTAHTADSLELVQKRIAAEEAILIDVREKDEWDSIGHLKAAISVPLSELKDKNSDADYAADLAKKLPKDKIIYCHCAAGGRVMPASAILHQLGYDVRPLKAGYDDLLEAGFKDAE